jgi:hypothetical protein
MLAMVQTNLDNSKVWRIYLIISCSQLNVITSPMLNGYVAYKYLGSQMLLALPP